MKVNIQIAVAVSQLILLSACDTMFIDQPENNPEAIFENVWTTYSEDYAQFEVRDVDWAAAYDSFRPMVNATTSDDELYTVLTEMLKIFDDGHVFLIAPGKDVFYSNRIMREKIDDALFNKEVIKTYLEPGYKMGEEESYIYGKIENENVGYIYFDYVGDNFFILNDFLDDFDQVNGYIFDMRHNHGGDFTYCFSEIGRLTDQRRYAFRSQTKNGTGPDDYTDWTEWYVEPEGDFVNKPIVVLTDRYTISAGERAIMAFKTLPNATIIGDTTNGAHSTLIGREMANGWYYTLGPQHVELFDGQSYEGMGLPPDIYIKNTLSEIDAGIDNTLQYAIDELK